MTTPNVSDSNIRLHPVTLVFGKSFQGLEKPFINHYYGNMQRQIRIGSIIAALFCLLFSFNDYHLLHENFLLYLKLRIFIMIPPCLVVTYVASSRHYFKFIEPVIGLTAFLIGLGTTIMVALAPPEKFIFYFLGYIEILFFLYTFVRLRFIWATSVTWLLLLIYALTCLYLNRLSHQYFVDSLIGLIAINVMGMFTSYAMEYHSRRNFFLSRQLEAKKRRLAIVNQHLEERVARRTVELTETNAKLQLEIKERKVIAKDLYTSKRRYRRMVNNVTDYICVHDMQGRILEVNRRMMDGLGYRLDELIGCHVSRVLTAEDFPAYDNYINRIVIKGSDQGMIRFVTKDGRIRLLEYSNVLAEHDTVAQAVYCLARDITDTRQAELALAESQARFKDIFESASAGMMIVEEKTQSVIEINPAAAQLVGQPAEMIKGRPINQLIRATAHQYDDETTATGEEAEEWELLSMVDGPIPVLRTIRPIEFDGQDHWIVSISSLQKIKEADNLKREMQNQLMQSQHLQAIGTLAGGIAHDFNNILFGILGYTQLALDDAPDGSLLKDNLGEIMQGGRRAKELISQILTFSRQGCAEKSLLDPKPMVKEALKLLRASIPTSVEIRADIASDIYAVHANTTQLHQVVMNLCTNAAQAIPPQGGRLNVILDNCVVDAEEKSPTGDLGPGRYLRLRVLDSGIGMEKEVLSRIFEPFFTTKPQGQGTGMGLSMVLGIVQDHGGAIRVSSDPGRGSCFDVLLPAVAAHGESEVEVETKPLAGTEHILFVDDEFPLIQMGRQMLSRLGYKVHCYQNAVEAVDYFVKNPTTIDLVITDLTMPKIGGLELARTVHQIRPDLPILLCTGNAEGIEEKVLEEAGVDGLILKPILRNDLARAIRQALATIADQNVVPISKTG